MKWILIPGLGADQRLFANMIDLLPDHQILDFVRPAPSETIEQYAGRIGEQVAVGGSFVLGGISFGGMLSSILCERLHPQALVLMSSTPRPEALRSALRVFEWLSRALPDTLAKWIRALGSHPMRWLEPIPPECVAFFKEMVRGADLEMIRHGGRMIMQWAEPPRIACRTFHLHGGRDMLIPADAVRATHVVPTAGHLLNITHTGEVRAFIEEVRQVSEG